MNNPSQYNSGKPDHPVDNERFALLWTDYLEGELDAAGMAELNELLADERLLALAADHYQTHRRLGLIASARREEGAARADAFIADVMKRLPADSDTLTRGIMDRLAAAARPANPTHDAKPSRWGFSRALLAGGGLLAALAIAVVAMISRPQSTRLPSGSLQSPAGRSTALTAQPVRFASLARARFLGRETPPRQAEVAVQETYVLSAGLVELAFPLGATAIVEGPAVFRVCGSDCLAIDAGRCSVHAPEGAEGFRVETPATRVIDRGTRFVVSVSDTADTEVRVIEGAADLFAKQSPASGPLALTAGSAARADPAVDSGRIAVVPDAEVSVAYQRQLPDRVVSYAASRRHPTAVDDPSLGDDADGIDTLEGVTVQRGGRVVSYRADQLIGVNVIHFCAGRNPHNLVSPAADSWTKVRMASAEVRRSLLEADRLLNSGIINPGGSQSPPSSEPRLAATADEEATPGIAVRFTQPVVNEPGPDVIFFDLQVLTDPPQGDAFHAGPIESAPGLHWHTITVYDIDSTSPESRLLARNRLFRLSATATSLAELLATPTLHPQVLPIRMKANAVGIDLSALGYADGATCGGLFFQDADDDAATIDPTFIAGLPPLAGDPAATGEAAR